MNNENENKNKPSTDPEKTPRSPGKPPLGGRYPQNKFHWILLALLGVMLFSSFSNMGSKGEEILLSEFLDRVKNGNVKEVVIYGDQIKGTMKDMEGQSAESSKNFIVKILPGVVDIEFIQLLRKDVEKVSCDTPNQFIHILLSLIPWILIFGFMYFFIFRQMRGGGGGGLLGSFGRSRHKVHSKEQSPVTFEDVAGIDESKEEVEEIIQFLRNPKKFQRLGGRIPRGILLIGEPGCGKTLLAKAIAGEADVPFFSISGSDFVEMFVGVGASRVRDLFKQAKDSSPCIIFLDEVDAIGRKRGASLSGGGNDEREQTLNAILVEMDGFSTNDQVIVIAATNRADVLDNALTRPGRFDRQVYVPLPDIKGRLEILKVHAKKIKTGPDVDLSRLARGTSMFSGADLEAIINEAALSATMEEKDHVEMTDLEEARDKVRWGRANRSRVVDEEDRKATAYHEAGHALVQSMLTHTDPVHKVSIIPRGRMGGATFSLPEKDRTTYSKKYCLDYIRVCHGGQVAEEIFCGDISSGAEGDIQQATSIARKMIMDWGMSQKLGFVHYGNDQASEMMSLGKAYSDQSALIIDSEVKEIMNEAYRDVKKILMENKAPIESLWQALIKYETIDGEEVKQVISGKPLDKPTVGELLAAEQTRSKNNVTLEDSTASPDPEQLRKDDPQGDS
ncbi:MAG: ATP-dependent zinc metalloprotease FtsH [Phycisphaerae bacterium]|nr:ATP-dependent zinc metalloprotease FtsH [Phycisphaerae bacterium]